MFYLKTYFKLYFRAGFKGISVLVVSILFSILCQSQNYAGKIMSSLSLQSYLHPYMTVFVDPGRMPQGLDSRIKLFDFVKDVQKVSIQEGMKQWWQTVKDLKLNSHWEDREPTGLRIIFNDRFKREYTKELLEVLDLKIGQDHLTASSVSYPQGQKFLKMHPLFQYLQKFGIWGVIVPLMVIYLMLLLLTQSQMNQELYMIERYQRRNLVKPKVVGVGLALTFGIGLLFSYFSSAIDPKGSLVTFVVLLLVWSLSFKPVSWRWNT